LPAMLCKAPKDRSASELALVIKTLSLIRLFRNANVPVKSLNDFLIQSSVKLQVKSFEFG